MLTFSNKPSCGSLSRWPILWSKGQSRPAGVALRNRHGYSYNANKRLRQDASLPQAASVELTPTTTANEIENSPSNSRPVTEDIEGLEVVFLVPNGKGAGFITGKKGGRVQELTKLHNVHVHFKRQRGKSYLRSLKVTARSAEAVAAFWDDVLTRAEKGNKVILDTTLDGKAYKLRMLIPKVVSGVLLGQKGQRLQKIAADTGCQLLLQERTAKDAVGSPLRLLNLAGNHASLVAAIREVLKAICEADTVYRVIPVAGFVSVPEDRVEQVNELLPEIAEKHPGVLLCNWVKPHLAARNQEGKRVIIRGLPSSVAAAKEELERIWGEPQWNSLDWPGNRIR